MHGPAAVILSGTPIIRSSGQLVPYFEVPFVVTQFHDAETTPLTFVPSKMPSPPPLTSKEDGNEYHIQAKLTVEQREALDRHVQSFVDKYGPEFGRPRLGRRPQKGPLSPGVSI